MFVNVEFESQGAVLRGRLYRPVGEGPHPVVVMTHGTSATITMTIDLYAEVFQHAGFAVLLYDHRNFGTSGGEPRQQINPWVQARGYQDATTYLESVPDIRSRAIVLWGDSYSAAEVIVVAAVDDRPAAVVSQIPAIGAQPPPLDPDGSLFAHLGATLRLMMIAPEDEMAAATPVVSRAAFDSVPGHKELVEIGGGHFGLLYHPSELFDHATTTQTDFLIRTLEQLGGPLTG